MVEKELKIILLGESGVGKSSIILRYYKDKFDSHLPSTFGSTFIKKDLQRDNNTYKLNIWDTTGQEKYHSVTQLFIRDTDIAILVYAIDDANSFKKLDFWYKEIIDNCGDNIILAIVGNKNDLFLNDNENENENIVFVPDEEAKKYADDKKAMFKLVTAKKDKMGIDSLFDELLNEYIAKGIVKIFDNKKENNVKIENDGIKKKDKKRGCC